MRVLLGVTSLRVSYGGPAFSVPALAGALSHASCDVALWTGDGSVRGMRQDPVAQQAKLYDGTLVAAFDDFRPDIVHDNGLWRWHNHALASLAQARRVPRVVSPRGMLEPWAFEHKGLKKRLAWAIYQRHDLGVAAALHATAESEAANLQRFGLSTPIWTIPNGMDLPSLHRAERAVGKALTALFLGRIHPKKGLPMLISAWAKVRPQGWRLVIAGSDEGGHLPEVQRAVADAKLNSVVLFPGPLYGDAKTAAFQGADLFLLPTYSENFGMAVAEALAHGVPVLTTTAAPWPMLERRCCGWRVAPTVAAIEEGLRRATACGAEALHAMGASGRGLIAEEFSWSRVANDFVSHYSQLL